MAFFLSLPQKASAGDCQCHEHNMFCFLVPCFFCTSPVPQGKDKWGGGIATSKRGTRVTELWTGNLNTSWWAPSTMWCCTGGQPQQKGSDLMIYRQLNYHYASTIPFALFGAEARSLHNSFSFSLELDLSCSVLPLLRKKKQKEETDWSLNNENR